MYSMSRGVAARPRGGCQWVRRLVGSRRPKTRRSGFQGDTSIFTDGGQKTIIIIVVVVVVVVVVVMLQAVGGGGES